MVEPIQGQIATLLSTTRVAINRGSEHGVTAGMKFHIRTSEIEIIDPETKDSLGKMYYIKGTIRIMTVRDKYSIGISDETTSILSFPMSRLIIKPFKLGSSPIERTDGINIGDDVIQVVSE